MPPPTPSGMQREAILAPLLTAGTTLTPTETVLLQALISEPAFLNGLTIDQSFEAMQEGREIDGESDKGRLRVYFNHLRGKLVDFFLLPESRRHGWVCELLKATEGAKHLKVRENRYVLKWVAIEIAIAPQAVERVATPARVEVVSRVPIVAPDKLVVASPQLHAQENGLALASMLAPGSAIWKDLLKKILLLELPRQFDRGFANNVLTARANVDDLLSNDECFNADLTNQARLESVAAGILRPSEWMGRPSGSREAMERRMSELNTPVRIAMPGIQLGSAALLMYLREEKKFALDLNFNYAHGVEMGEALVERDIDPWPDIVVTGHAPALHLLNTPKLHWDFGLQMPSNEQRIARAAAVLETKETLEGDYVFLEREHSTLMFHFKAIQLRSGLPRDRFRIKNAEPQHLYRLFTHPTDERMIVWSPHWQVLEALQVIKTYSSSSYWFASLLFVSTHFQATSPWQMQSLFVAILDAWWRFRTQPDSLACAVDHLVNDKDWRETILLYCGLGNLRSASAAAGLIHSQ